MILVFIVPRFRESKEGVEQRDEVEWILANKYKSSTLEIYLLYKS